MIAPQVCIGALHFRQLRAGLRCCSAPAPSASAAACRRRSQLFDLEGLSGKTLVQSNQ